MYHSYKRFNADKYEKDLSCAPFHVGEVFDNIDDCYWYYETLLKEIANGNAPLKVKTIGHAQVPYMNGELRGAINCKNMLRRKFYKNRNCANWELYRRHRKYDLKLRRKVCLYI